MAIDGVGNIATGKHAGDIGLRGGVLYDDVALGIAFKCRAEDIAVGVTPIWGPTRREGHVRPLGLPPWILRWPVVTLGPGAMMSLAEHSRSRAR